MVIYNLCSGDRDALARGRALRSDWPAVGADVSSIFDSRLAELD